MGEETKKEVRRSQQPLLSMIPSGCYVDNDYTGRKSGYYNDINIYKKILIVSFPNISTPCISQSLSRFM